MERSTCREAVRDLAPVCNRFQAQLRALITANPTLLGCGNYYVAATEPGDLVGCGCWTPEKPGTGEIIEGEGHIRHFATHSQWIRHGIGSALLGRCISDSRSIGVRKLRCLTTLSAEHFYRAAGFKHGWAN